MNFSQKPKKLKPFSAPKGVPDYVPPVPHEFETVRNSFQHRVRLVGYEHIELPIFEKIGLFAHGIGESTDVVTKEMYTFADRGDRSVTLRPEGTADVMRTVIEYNLDRGQLPVKLSYTGSFFHYERPQVGRYCQLQRVGVEVIDIDDPALDAEVIALADACFCGIGLEGFRLELTSLGNNTCRSEYHAKLREFLFDLPLDEEMRYCANINPLHVLDDKRPEMQGILTNVPLILDHLFDSTRSHFEAVTGLLDDMRMPYVINPRVVRGLDYYTKTCFEFVHDGLGVQSGIDGGGRYDGLMAQLGGQELSGIGFGLGVDRALLTLEVESKQASDGRHVDIYGVALGGEAAHAMALQINKLRQAGARAGISYSGRGLKGAMKGADRAGARFALVLGESGLAAGEVQLKNPESHEQHAVALDALVQELQSRIWETRIC